MSTTYKDAGEEVIGKISARNIAELQELIRGDEARIAECEKRWQARCAVALRSVPLILFCLELFALPRHLSFSGPLLGKAQPPSGSRCLAVFIWVAPEWKSSAPSVAL